MTISLRRFKTQFKVNTNASNVFSSYFREKKDKERNDFCLPCVFADGAHLSEKAKEKESKEEDDQVGEDLNEPEPFGVTSGARSKL